MGHCDWPQYNLGEYVPKSTSATKLSLRIAIETLRD
ncbi:hypothetical protein LINGRAHAP2_LOCUS17865 [Linum grandiflorum]